MSLGLAWLLVVLLFRLFEPAGQMRAFDTSDPKTRVRFYVMTYALKNLYQGMLFFLLPFYWKSTTLDAANVWFVIVLAACAVVSTLDIVFDRVLMRWRWMASTFHALTLFGVPEPRHPGALARHAHALVAPRGGRHRGRELLDAARDDAPAQEEDHLRRSSR